MSTPSPFVVWATLSWLAVLSAPSLHAQGCVAARGCNLHSLHEGGSPVGSWSAAVSHRWFESDRHFVGGHEETQRRAEGSEVINRSHFSELTVTYQAAPRWSVTLALPWVSHDRSQVVRDNNRVILKRFHTQASGLADVRIEGAYTVVQASPESRGNLQVGFGLALPTGKKDLRDTFSVYDNATKKILAEERTVDQSIQPGSGGYAVLVSVNGTYRVWEKLLAYADGSYSLTPQEKNGVPTFRSNPYEAEMSIADTYLVRAGLEYPVLPQYGLSLSLGLRAEGVPVRDVVGGSKAFRRPGYSIAYEPGLAWSQGRWSARLYVASALKRNRLRSVADEQWTAASGVHRHGDAAFADYLVASSVAFRF